MKIPWRGGVRNREGEILGIESEGGRKEGGGRDLNGLLNKYFQIILYTARYTGRTVGCCTLWTMFCTIFSGLYPRGMYVQPSD